MKIEIGKEYKTRSGLKVKVYDITENKNYPVIAGVLESNNISPRTYTKEGKLHLNSESGYDIVGEWQEPLDFDWSCLPAWCNNYIAMDESGIWFAFSMMPERKSAYRFWRKGIGESVFIPEEYAPKNFKNTWEKSLFKNPNKCEK